MSARVSNCVPTKSCGPSSRQKKMVLEVNLNVPLADHSDFNEVGPSVRAPVVPEMCGGLQRPQSPPVTIDVDSIDDDVVVLSSPRSFAQARNNSRRDRSRSIVMDVNLESSNRDAANNSNKRRRVPTNQPIIDCEALVIPDRSRSIVNEFGRNLAAQLRKFVAPPPPPPPSPPPPPPPPHPPPEPTFSCPICTGPFVDEMSTKCGHIFCRECIKKAISFQGKNAKCPSCRTKVTMRGVIRVYLPKSS